jgi:crossover junction endodeoxyribonuclease RuvC
VTGLAAESSQHYPQLPAGGVVGIDPGKSGAIAYVIGRAAFAWKLRDLTDRDIYDRLVWLSGFAERAVIERVAARPKQGVSSVFTFGENYGALQMALVAAGLPFERVTPGKWQGDLGCRTKGDKNITKRKAQELFPEVKIIHANADSILIGWWGLRTSREGAICHVK